MLKRIWARGISFCLISAEKRQVSQKKISEKAPNQHFYSTTSIPSSLYPSVSTQNKPVIFWVVSYGVVYVSPSCISGGIWRWVWISLYLNENHSHLGGYITGFDSNVKGFFCLFLPYFALFFLDISCWTCHTSYVNWEKRGKFMLVLESFAALVFTLVYVMYLYVQPKVVKLYNSWRFS